MNSPLSIQRSWSAWVRHIQQREQPRPVRRVIPAGRKSPLLWSLPNELADQPRHASVDLIHRLSQPRSKLDNSVKETLDAWLNDAEHRAMSAPFVLECLGWCYALPVLASHLPAGGWWRLLERLVQIANFDGSPTDEDPLTHQLLNGELPLALSYQFPEVPSCRELAPAACQTLSAGIVEVLDGNGLPHTDWLPLARPLLACWTRGVLLMRESPVDGLGEEARSVLEWFVRQTLLLSRSDGSQVLSAGRCGAYDKRLFDAALGLSPDEEDTAIANVLLKNRRAEPEGQRRDGQQPGGLPIPTANSEWAHLSVLRSTWHSDREHLTVAYNKSEIRAELNNLHQTVWSGDCPLRVVVDGRQMKTESDWRELCWHSDEDVDYLEIEMNIGAGWKLQRQWLLARHDRFLLACDAVVGERPGRIERTSTLPLGPSVRFVAAKQTSEGFLTARRRVALVLPLAVPEWRGQHGHGRLAATAAGLEHRLVAEGRALYAPMFFDLDPQRMRRRVTWRRLTVAEDLQSQPPDVAVGYRVQVGDSQWLVYRSLAPRASRTVLGQNISSEFFIGRFLANGVTKELLSIE